MKHLSTFFRAWSDESQRRKKNRRRKIDTAFLPAALEIMDTPPRPIGRAILWVIVAAVIFALVWALLAKVDIVAVSEGRIIPRGRLQSVETSETGTVRKILVTEGQKVKAGDPLIELDPTYADADAQAAQSELATAYLQEARALALLDYAEGKPWVIKAHVSASASALEAEKRLVAARISEHKAKLQSLEARKSAANLAMSQAKNEIGRIDASLPILKRQLDNQSALSGKGYAPRNQTDELEVKYSNLKFERRTQIDEFFKSENEIGMISRDIEAQVYAFRAAASAELSEARAIISTRGAIVEKAERRKALQHLVAPVDATVNEISVTTIGEVAEPGKPLITLVPVDDELIIEAFILNRDIGFVKSGQPVIIKLEAFPFMRYGFLDGEIEHVSPDAVIDEARGLIYPARVKITGSSLRTERLQLVDGFTHSIDQGGHTENDAQASSLIPSFIQAGMAVTAEVKTGERSVLSYLLSPIAKATNEAGRER